ncbi:hypothetical protein ECZU29_61300 [Escherichia coli]|nr:hypothetical protein ECZU29_61300 [Escherichia coli]
MKDDNSTDKKKPAPRLRRIGDIGINLFAPLAETRWMLRSCRHMLGQHKTRLKRLMPDRQPESPVCMTRKKPSGPAALRSTNWIGVCDVAGCSGGQDSG